MDQFQKQTSGNKVIHLRTVQVFRPHKSFLQPTMGEARQYGINEEVDL